MSREVNRIVTRGPTVANLHGANGRSRASLSAAAPAETELFYLALLTIRIPSLIVTSTALTQGSVETVRFSS